MSKSVDIVKSYYEAFDHHDFQRARTLMHDQFRFTGPMMEAASPEELLAKMKEFDCEFKNRVIHVAESGDTIGILLECTFTKPFSATIRMSEWFKIDGGKIASSNLIYDTRQMPDMQMS